MVWTLWSSCSRNDTVYGFCKIYHQRTDCIYKSQGRVCMYYFLTFLCILESCVFGPRLKFIFVFLKQYEVLNCRENYIMWHHYGHHCLLFLSDVTGLLTSRLCGLHTLYYYVGLQLMGFSSPRYFTFRMHGSGTMSLRP